MPLKVTSKRPYWPRESSRNGTSTWARLQKAGAWLPFLTIGKQDPVPAPDTRLERIANIHFSEDGITPYFVFIKHGLKGMKV